MGPLNSCFSEDIYTFIGRFSGVNNALDVQRQVSYKVLALQLLSSHLLKDNFLQGPKENTTICGDFETLCKVGFVLIPLPCPVSTVVLSCLQFHFQPFQLTMAQRLGLLHSCSCKPRFVRDVLVLRAGFVLFAIRILCLFMPIKTFS